MARLKRKRTTRDELIVRKIQEIKGCNAKKAWAHHKYKLAMAEVNFIGNE